MLVVSQGKAVRDSSKAVGSEGANGADGAILQRFDAIDRNILELRPSQGAHLEEQGASGSVPAPALTATFSEPASLDLATSSLPKIETALASSPKSEASVNTSADESAKLHQAAEQRSAFLLREHFPFGKATYDYYFSPGGVIRDAVDLMTHGVGWMSGVSVVGTSLALFGLAPVPFFGGVAAGMGAYQAVQFMGRALTGAIWGKDGLI